MNKFLSITMEVVALSIILVVFYSEYIGVYYWLALAMAIIGIVLIVLYLRARFNIIIGTKIDALAATAFDLVRLMELSLPSGWKGRLQLVKETTQQFAITGIERIGSTNTALINMSRQQDPHVFHKTAEDINARWLQDQRNFLSFRSGVRSGVDIFLLLMAQDNIQGAFMAMIRHMTTQITKADWENHANLKLLFELPEDRPTAKMVAKLRARELSKWQYFTIGYAMTKGRERIMYSLVYSPPTLEGKEQIIIKGENVLKAMRVFLTSGDTYDERLK